MMCAIFISITGVFSSFLLKDTERMDAPPQLNPFAMAARGSTVHKQTEML